jgi:hypothetical protein
VALGGHPVVGPVYEMLLPHRSRFVIQGIGAVSLGSTERLLGILAGTLGRREEAAGHFEAALGANRRAGAPLLVAHTLRDAGRVLGDPERLAEAGQIYRELGLDHQAREAKALLDKLPAGETPDRSAGSVFRKEGEFWTIGFAGRVVRLKDAKGLHDLVRLLARPGQELHVLDLAGGPTSGREGRASPVEPPTWALI